MHTKRIMTIVLAALLVALALASCGKDKETTAPAAAATAIPAPAAGAAESAAASAASSAENATESPLLAAGESPLATPAANSPIPTPTPETSGLTGASTADTGSVSGRILVTRDGVDTPVGNVIVGLADVIRDETGAPKASGYSPDTAVKGVTDDAGGFTIDNVPVGLYSLILDAVITSYQLENPKSGETILIDVKAGENVDIGVQRYAELPLPGFGTSK
jgi:hypothetical protein